MTHKDIYTKFMIEYDKANVTSSYPSLTEYEVATVLDKAYHALIAQKVTGNNVRRVALEGDLKSISDIAPLITNDAKTISKLEYLNVYKADLPEDYLYYITASLVRKNQHVKYDTEVRYYCIGENYTGTVNHTLYDISGHTYETGSYITDLIDNGGNSINDLNIAEDEVVCVQVEIESVDFVGTKTYYFKKHTSGKVVKQDDDAIDQISNRKVKVKLVNHQIADKFIASDSNIPWVKNPVCYIEDDNIYIVCDSWNTPTENAIDITYIKTPNKFVKDIEKIYDDFHNDDPSLASLKISYFDYEIGNEFIPGTIDPEEYIGKHYVFECNDTVAEELISLAVAFALENVESLRLNSKLNMRGLEA